jgi:hypothetical protein
MAGAMTMAFHRRWGNFECPECDEDAPVIESEFVTVGTLKNPKGTERLMVYWTTGEGGTVKIRWGTDGSFRRCVRHLRKYFPKDPKGLCANLHHRATGEWPREHGKLGIPS